MNFNSKNGEVIIELGTMFAGKTSGLQSAVRSCRIAKLNVGVFKPRLDNRYSDVSVVNHDGKSLNAISVNTIDEIKHISNTNEYDVIAIDEFQFIDIKSASNLRLFIKDEIFGKGRKLVISGLNLDSEMFPFDNMKEILPYATTINKHTAICMDCLEPAYIIHCVVPKTSQIMVGGNDTYVPVCPNCYLRRKQLDTVKED